VGTACRGCRSICWATPLYLHYLHFHTLNMYHIFITLFCSINIMICIWELSLFYYIEHILKEYVYKHLKQHVEKKQLPQTLFLFQDVKLNEILNLKYWSIVWLTYSIMDYSYANQESYGYFIDSGNGFTTLLPSILWLYGLSSNIMSPRIFGIIGLLMFYQEFYGTVIYMMSYLVNRRFKGWKISNIITMVIIPNFIWFIFPALGLYISYNLVMENSYNLVR